MSVWCGARGRMERREAFHKLKLRRSGRGCWAGGGGGVWVRHSGDHRQDYKKKEERGGLKHGANVWNYTLGFNCPPFKAPTVPLFTMQDPLCFQTIIRVERRRVTIENMSSNLRELKMGRYHFYMLKKKKRRHKNAALAPPQQRGLFGSCNTAPSRYVQIRCAAETIYRLSPSLLKSICNWESLRCRPYCVASPWLSVGFNEK